jgi:hypothetical protein
MLPSSYLFFITRIVPSILRKQLEDELAKLNISTIENFISINTQYQITQIMRQISLGHLNEDEDKAIEKKFEERYEEEIGNLKYNHNAIQ